MSRDLVSEFSNAKSGADLAKGAADAHEQEANNPGFLGEVWQSAKYSAVQAPVLGITQIVDRVAGSNLTEKATFMEKPKEATDFAGWHAQQIGSAIGIIPWFAAMNYGVHKGFDKVLAMRGAESVGLMSMGRAVTESAIAGGLYEGLLTTSSDKESLLGGRFKNATHGALTFGTMTGTARVLNDYGILKNRIGIGVVSGLPAGFVSAESESLLHGKGPASFDDIAKSMYTFGMVGGALTAIHSIPLGERGTSNSKAEGNRVAENTNQSGAKIEPVEYRIADAQSREALDAFRRGETKTAWAEVLKGGEPKRLFVQHEGTLPFEVGTRADFVALCNLPEISPFARRLALPGATDRPIFMDFTGENNVRFAETKLSPEAVALGPKENIARSRSLMEREGIEPLRLPKWLGDFKPTGQVWAGNNSVVLELAPKEGFPEVVLKIKRGDWEGQKPYNADIYDAQGKKNSSAVFETENAGAGEEPLYIFLEDRVDYNHFDTNGLQELMDSLAQRGLQVSDPGSGPPIGRSRNSGEWKVADRDAVSKIGSGEHEVERAMALGAEEYEAQREREERQEEDTWDNVQDAESLAAAQDAVRGFKLLGTKLTEARSVFGIEDPQAAIKSLVEQMTDGMSTKEDVKIMQQYAFANGDAKAATSQMRFVARLLKAAKLPGRNDWVDSMAK